MTRCEPPRRSSPRCMFWRRVLLMPASVKSEGVGLCRGPMTTQSATILTTPLGDDDEKVEDAEDEQERHQSRDEIARPGLKENESEFNHRKFANLKTQISDFIAVCDRRGGECVSVPPAVAGGYYPRERP